jgi:hypothetical protein
MYAARLLRRRVISATRLTVTKKNAAHIPKRYIASPSTSEYGMEYQEKKT